MKVFQQFILLLMSICFHVLISCACVAQGNSNTPSIAAIGSLSLDSGTVWLQHVFDDRIHDSVQIVGLGEVSHGGFEPMAFKVKMIQYLVEKRGYRNILFELPDFGALMPVRDNLNNSRVEEPAISGSGVKGVSLLPAGETVLRALFHWLMLYNLKHPTDKAYVRGFDLIHEKGIYNYVLYKYIVPFDPEGAKKIIYRLSDAGTLDTIKIQIISDWIKGHATMLKARLDKEELDQLDFFVRNSQYACLYLLKGSEELSNMYRDSIMANNVKELTGSAKAIVWAHNAHISRWNAHLMGAYLEQYYQSRFFTLVTDFSEIATVDVLDKKKPVSDSGYFFQKLFTSAASTTANTMFRRYGISSGIMFRNDIIKYSLPMEANLIDVYGLHTEIRSEKAFDALVFFDEVHRNSATYKSEL